MTSQKPGRNLALYRDYVGQWDRLDLFRIVARHFRRRTRNFFSDASVLCMVDRKREYEQPAEVAFHFADYGTPLDVPDESFDLLISQWAGFVSQPWLRWTATTPSSAS